MKKLLLAAAVTTLSLSAAQAAPTLYGKVNVSVDSYDDGKDDKVEVNSNASRLGVKGEEKLTEKLSAVYQAEWEIDVDGGDDVFKKRNIFAGLKWANLGTLKAGIMDTPFKDAASGYRDVFNDYAHADIKEMMYGEERVENVIGIETDPKLMGGLVFALQAQQGESTSSTVTYTDGARDSVGDGISTSLSYANKDLGLEGVISGNFKSIGDFAAVGISNAPADAIRVGASFDLGKIGATGLFLGAMWQTAEISDYLGTETYRNIEENAWLLSATYKLGNTPWSFKAQYQEADTDWTTATVTGDTSAKQWGIGADYKLNSQTKLFASAVQREWDNKRTSAGAATAIPNADESVYGLGMEIKF
ncbi:MAG: porin [Acinetobacter sp.]|jgi:predicted porin|uniref:Outer membrane protein (Porin) n=1 Tax=Acinetobacter bohemicus TaxID=1435036 RepID=A0A1I6RL11_9GAMM|nr:porin [Acinetobacter bohemicus]KAB0653460.1 porin [Acinetobacter bohemicus]MBP8071409.1 porin [Acinetobacter sp.]SFS65372.1 Outer membrane protein (porin) [Acinetobacter bohemicus]